MARNRVIYQSEALFMNKAAQWFDGYLQLERVQSANYNYTINRQDVNQYGQLGKLDSIILDAPTVSADVSYYVTDGYTERVLGFWVDYNGSSDGSSAGVSFVSGHLADGSGTNMVILTTPEGTDADLPSRTSLATTNSAIGIGNCYLTDYSLDLAVGAIPTVSVSFDALNINAEDDASSIVSPAINVLDGEPIGGTTISLPDATTGIGTITALRPGDITVDIANFEGDGLINITSGVEGAHVQSASLSIPLSRSALERLGSKTAYARSVDFPVVATLAVTAIVNEAETSNLAELLDSENEKTVTLTLKADDDTALGVKYTLKGCSFDSESITSSIGSNKSVDLSFSTSVGGPSDTAHGVFMSGSSNNRGNM